MSLFNFGAGVMFATPKIDVNGSTVSNPSPVQFGVLQNITPDETFEFKELYGANQFPVAIGRGKGKLMLKAQLANISAELFNTVLYGLTATSSYEKIYADQTGQAIPTGSTSSDVTPTSPTSIVVADLGVQSAINGVPYTRIGTGGTGPTGGQYQYNNAGVWTFAAFADGGKTPLISYVYSLTAGDAKLITVTNKQMGTAPVFSVDLNTQFQGGSLYVRFPNVTGTKLSAGYKNDDFSIYDLEMQCSQDASGNIAYKYFSQ
jgi:hypothetical protein